MEFGFGNRGSRSGCSFWYFEIFLNILNESVVLNGSARTYNNFISDIVLIVIVLDHFFADNAHVVRRS